MGRRGPPPTPTPILEARGSWRAKLNRDEPRPKPGAPPAPKGLTDPERKVWRALVRTLGDMGVLTTADGGVMERYCRFLVRWRACEEFVAKNGMTYPLKAGPGATGGPPTGGFVGRLPDGTYIVGWAEFAQLRESHRLDKALKQIEDRLGLSPAARTRLTAADGAGPKLHGGDASDGGDDAYFFDPQAV